MPNYCLLDLVLVCRSYFYICYLSYHSSSLYFLYFFRCDYDLFEEFYRCYFL